MKILFLGDIVGISGRSMVLNNLLSKIKKVIKIGLAFSYQNLKKIPTNQHDKRLDFIITEKEILK